MLPFLYIDEMMKLAIDKRYQDDVSRRQSYEDMTKDDMRRLSNVQILSVEEIGPDDMRVKVSANSKETGTFEITLPLHRL